MTFTELENLFRGVVRISRLLRRALIGGMIAGGLFLASRVIFYAGSTATGGLVVALDMRDDVSFPIFEFTDATGERHRVRSDTGGKPGMYSLGEPVTVRYGESRPTPPESTPSDSSGEGLFYV
jgi:hypothetical protein